MNTGSKKVVSAFALTALVLVSFVSVCRQMVSACGSNCAEQAMSAWHVGDRADACTQGMAICSDVVGGHMATFASLYPSAAASGPTLLLAVGFALLAWFLQSKHTHDHRDRFRVKWRSLRLRIVASVTPDFLVFAFSRGILHSKIYA
jgi:hypothetical protein